MGQQSNHTLRLLSYDEARKTVDQGFPKRFDQTFPDVTGRVTAAFQYRGELHSKLCRFFLKWEKACTETNGEHLFAGFAYIYSGPLMFEYSLRSKRLYRVLDNSYFLRCTNY